ncbi:MAG: hypothetical protein P8168_10880 [Deltaproteobacteria bacterium]|jgi:hypothetical protein
MGPRLSIHRRGEDIFFTVEGKFNHESSRELLTVVRKLLTTALKCTAPGSWMAYSIKTRSKVDLEKLNQFQQGNKVQSGVGEDDNQRPEPGVKLSQGESAPRRPRHGLVLVKGGAL